MTVPRFRLSERHILLFILVGAILGYGGAMLLLRLRKNVRRAAAYHQPMVRWMSPDPDGKVKEIHYVIADLLDPSLMSLPSAHGFSRQLWQRQAPATRRDFEPRTELALLNAETAFVFQALLEQPSLADVVQSSAEKASAESEEAAETESSSPTTAMNHTVLKVVASIGDRPILQMPELPAITSDTPVRPTRVRVAVAADGTVRYAVLDHSSGSGDAAVQADAQALELAHKIRFAPENAADARTLTWGVVRFIWATASPTAATNEAKTARQ